MKQPFKPVETLLSRLGLTIRAATIASDDRLSADDERLVDRRRVGAVRAGKQPAATVDVAKHHTPGNFERANRIGRQRLLHEPHPDRQRRLRAGKPYGRAIVEPDPNAGDQIW